LRTNDGFCCLGVACDVKNKENWVKQSFNYQEECVYEYKDVNSFAKDILPLDVQEWLGLNTSSGKFFKNKEDPFSWTYLTELNDEGKTFEEIADIIEANQEQLFVE
jgi:hypothetical protein